MLYELTREIIEKSEVSTSPLFNYTGPSLKEFDKAKLEGMKYVAFSLTGSILYAKGPEELSLEEIMFRK